jgi:hypothetical protein
MNALAEGQRTKPKKELREYGPLDHIRHIWKGPDGGYRQPAGETWLDREAKILTVLIIHAWGNVVKGFTLPYLLEKARVSRSDWFRAMRVLVMADVVKVHHPDKVRNTHGEVRSRPNTYTLCPETLLGWTGRVRPAAWPQEKIPPLADRSPPLPGPYEQAFEEACVRLDLDLGSENVKREQRLMRRTDREVRRLSATQKRLDRELERLAERRKNVQQTVAEAEAKLAARRQEAGLGSSPLVHAVEIDRAEAREADQGSAAQTPEVSVPVPAGAESEATPVRSGADRGYTENPRSTAPALLPSLRVAPDASRAPPVPCRDDAEEEVPPARSSAPGGPSAGMRPSDQAATTDDELVAFATGIAESSAFARNVVSRVQKRVGFVLTEAERDRLREMRAEARPALARTKPLESVPAERKPERLPLWGPAETLRVPIVRPRSPPTEGS